MPGDESGAAEFRLIDDGARWACTRAITFDNARQALESSRGLPLPQAGVVDCSALHPVDSAAVAVLLAIKRRAIGEGRSLTFINITPSLHTLADLYGVEEILVG